jgi:hypothetical protein
MKMETSMPPSPDGLSWRRAQRCDAANCIEVAASGDSIVIRDSKSAQGPVLTYDRAEWETFVEGIKLGDFDSLI